jgi:hypothetical protein
MPIWNFELRGVDLIRRFAEKHPMRAERLVGALESFVEGGESILLDRAPWDVMTDADLEVHLVSRQMIIEAVPDVSAVVVVNYAAKIIDIHMIICDFEETVGAFWYRVMTVARQATASGHGR